MYLFPILVLGISFLSVFCINSHSTRFRFQFPTVPTKYFGPGRVSHERMNHYRNVSRLLNVGSPWNAPSWVWNIAWKIQKFFLPLLYKFDRLQTKDSFVNLYVLWWKAIAGNRWGTRTYDGGYAYDLLPSWTRLIVAFPLCFLYPALHHQTVAMRTAFLDKSLTNELEKCSLSASNATIVISLGGGFDTRSLRFRHNPRYSNVTFFELDLPDVIAQKERLLSRFYQRRPKLRSLGTPHLLSADLNDTPSLKDSLTSIVQRFLEYKTSALLKRVIVVSEAVMLYVEPENIGSALSTIPQVFSKDRGYECISLCFADRFVKVSIDEESPEVEKNRVAAFLHAFGNFRLDSFIVKPGKARHLGIAHAACA